MRPALILALCLAGSSAASALAAAPPPGPLAVSIVEAYLLPRYRSFAETTAAQAKGWSDACADGDFAADAGALKERFQVSADAWAAVEHTSVGPVSVGLRADRIYFNPDRRNAVSKAVSELEAKAGDADITSETIRGVSVAGQGFPALERLLYEPDQAGAGARCRVGVAISGNLASIAADIVSEWTGTDGPLARLKRGEGDPLHFADPAQALARLMTDLAGGVQRANDVKLFPVLGSALDMARPKAAEGWRSGRSARAVKLLTASLAAEAKTLAAAVPRDIAAADGKAYDAAQAAVAKLPDDLGEAAADPKRRRLVEAAVTALKAAQNDVAKNLAPALGVPLGFNALDGD